MVRLSLVVKNVIISIRNVHKYTAMFSLGEARAEPNARACLVAIGIYPKRLL